MPRRKSDLTVDLAHKQTSKDDLVEGGIGSASQESVELDEKAQVDIGGLWLLAVGVAHVVLVKIDTIRNILLSQCVRMLKVALMSDDKQSFLTTLELLSQEVALLL